MSPLIGHLRRRAARQLDGLELLHESDASLFGVQSRGMRQTRGNGTLALTAEELVFARWAPAGVWRLPLDTVIGVATTRRHLGKTAKRDLLRVTWKTDAGADAIAFAVVDLEAWVDALRDVQPDALR